MTAEFVPFTAQHQDLLRNTQIDAMQPGPIVQAFQTMLAYLQSNVAQLTASGMLPLRTLEPLNEQLVRSIQHGLKRPQQKSFPHINGLYLLLRASGMTFLDTSGKKPSLAFDGDVVASWQRLHAVDQYCTLLETWLLRGNESLIGERDTFMFLPPLLKWRDFFIWRLARENRRRIEADQNGDLSDDLRYYPALHNLALLELFGFVEIEDAPPQEGSAWRIAAVEHTALGDAMLGLLTREVMGDLIDQGIFEAPHEAMAGTLQPYLQPYIPGWQNTLSIPENEFQDGIFIFTVALARDLWRRIAIPAGETLEDFSDAILSAYRFDDDHLYRFVYPTRFGMSAQVFHPYMDEGPATTEVQIGELPLRPGMTMFYNYDFGDNWYFEITLDRIDPPDRRRKRAQVIEKEGKAPEQYPEW